MQKRVLAQETTLNEPALVCSTVHPALFGVDASARAPEAATPDTNKRADTPTAGTARTVTTVSRRRSRRVTPHPEAGHGRARRQFDCPAARADRATARKAPPQSNPYTSTPASTAGAEPL